MNDFPSIPEFQDANVVPMTFVLYFFYTASVAVLMLNLLIAMLNDTFYNIKKRARLQWKVEVIFLSLSPSSIVFFLIFKNFVIQILVGFNHSFN